MCKDLPTYFVAHSFPGFSVAAGWRGWIIYTYAHDHADLVSQGAMSADTPVRLGSFSKVFATAAILRLNQDNHIDLHDPLEKYFPRCSAVDNKPAATCPDRSAPGTRVTEVARTQHCACTLT
jgi:CubicO group peptidase (beta-lactamase class C family)